MKKILFLLAMCFCLLSCGNKKDTIDKFMFENLYDYESYQLIEMKEIGNSIVELKFRCKSAGGISKINNWTFNFDDNGDISSVMDFEKKGEEALIYIK